MMIVKGFYAIVVAVKKTKKQGDVRKSTREAVKSAPTTS